MKENDKWVILDGRVQLERATGVAYGATRQWAADGKLSEHLVDPRLHILIGKQPKGAHSHPIIEKCQFCNGLKPLAQWTTPAELWIWRTFDDVYAGWVGYCGECFTSSHDLILKFETYGLNHDLNAFFLTALQDAHIYLNSLDDKVCPDCPTVFAHVDVRDAHHYYYHNIRTDALICLKGLNEALQNIREAGDVPDLVIPEHVTSDSQYPGGIQPGQYWGFEKVEALIDAHSDNVEALTFISEMLEE